jgi:hypothetical protein
MASPFNMFRKNMKGIMAFMFVILMLTWVIGDSVMNFFGGDRSRASNRQTAGAVAVSWDGGKLTNQQLNELVMRRRMLNEFLGQVEASGQRSAYEAGVEPRPLHVQILRGPDSSQQHVEESVLQTKLFADAARAAGMSVSDDAIRQYLDELGRGQVTRDDMRTILNRMRGGGRISIDDIMAALREEMLARNYMNSNQYAFMTVTPDQGWRDWLRVNDRVVLEAAAIPTDKYLVDVKDPTEDELTEFYNKYKDQEVGPEVAYGTTELPSARPGFRIPRKLDVQFIEASYDNYLAKAEEKVTDEEIAKYYEEHKDPMFVKADTGILEDSNGKKEAGKSEGTGTSGEKGADSAKPSAETGTAPGADSKPAADAGKNSAEKPAETPGNDDKDSAKSKSGKQSSLRNGSSNRVFHLVAFNDPAKDEPGAKKDVSTESKSADQASAQPKDGATAPPVSATPATPPSDAKAPPAATAPKKPLQFDSLDAVKDVIRRQIADNNVAAELTKLTNQIDGELEADYNKYYGEVLTAQAEKREAPEVPKSLTDLAPLAEKFGLKVSKTGPITLLDLRQTPVGKSVVPDTGRALWQVFFFGKEVDLYQPISTVEHPEGNHYVAMKVNDTAARTPPLKEIRDEVVKAWKFQKAAEIAQKNAEELAKKAQEAKSPLATFFADDPSIKVTRTDPFSELTGGDMGVVNGQVEQTPFRLSQPEGLHAPGPEFMQKVFQLKDGETAGLLSHDHTIAYVVRVAEHQPSINELRTAYLGEANNWSGLYNMMRDRVQGAQSALQRDIVAGAHVDWKRDPDKVGESEEPNAG